MGDQDVAQHACQRMASNIPSFLAHKLGHGPRTDALVLLRLLCVLSPAVYLISVLGAGIRHCNHRGVSLVLHVQLRGHERAEARVFALDLGKCGQSAEG